MTSFTDNAVGDILQELRRLGLGTAIHLDTEAEQHRRHDQGQNGPAAQQLRKVRLRKEIDDHIAEAQCFADLALHNGVMSIYQREDAADDIHQYTGNGGGDEERGDGHAHDLAGARAS